MAKSDNELNKEFASQVSKADLKQFEADGFECGSEAPLLTLAVGECLSGKFVEKGTYQVNDRKEGLKTLPCYTFETEKGAIRLGGKVTLDKAMANVKAGDLCKVVRGGDEKTNADHTLPVYKVYVKRGV